MGRGSSSRWCRAASRIPRRWRRSRGLGRPSFGSGGRAVRAAGGDGEPAGDSPRLPLSETAGGDRDRPLRAGRGPHPGTGQHGDDSAHRRGRWAVLGLADRRDHRSVRAEGRAGRHGRPVRPSPPPAAESPRGHGRSWPALATTLSGWQYPARGDLVLRRRLPASRQRPGDRQRGERDRGSPTSAGRSAFPCPATPSRSTWPRPRRSCSSRPCAATSWTERGYSPDVAEHGGDGSSGLEPSVGDESLLSRSQRVR